MRSARSTKRWSRDADGSGAALFVVVELTRAFEEAADALMHAAHLLREHTLARRGPLGGRRAAPLGRRRPARIAPAGAYPPGRARVRARRPRVPGPGRERDRRQGTRACADGPRRAAGARGGGAEDRASGAAARLPRRRRRACEDVLEGAVEALERTAPACGLAARARRCCCRCAPGRRCRCRGCSRPCSTSACARPPRAG